MYFLHKTPANICVALGTLGRENNEMNEQRISIPRNYSSSNVPYCWGAGNGKLVVADAQATTFLLFGHCSLANGPCSHSCWRYQLQQCVVVVCHSSKLYGIDSNQSGMLTPFPAYKHTHIAAAYAPALAPLLTHLVRPDLRPPPSFAPTTCNIIYALQLGSGISENSCQ